VLAEIGVGPEAGEGAPIVEVWNKLDALGPETHERIVADAARDQDVIAISALSGEGIEALRRTVAERLLAGARVHSIALPAADGGAIAWLHQHGEVIEQEMDGETLTMDVRLSPDEWDRFQSRAAKQA